MSLSAANEDRRAEYRQQSERTCEGEVRMTRACCSSHSASPAACFNLFNLRTLLSCLPFPPPAPCPVPLPGYSTREVGTAMTMRNTLASSRRKDTGKYVTMLGCRPIDVWLNVQSSARRSGGDRPEETESEKQNRRKERGTIANSHGGETKVRM